MSLLVLILLLLLIWAIAGSIIFNPLWLILIIIVIAVFIIGSRGERSWF